MDATGTVFLEVWKRTNASLSYEWDVDSFESLETDRPEFVGTKEIPDPVVHGEVQQYSPFHRQCAKFAISLSVLVFMVCLVFIIAAAIILYRIVITIDYCGSMTPTNCLLATTVVSSLLNAIAILILGKLYDWLAIKLTDWENHRTQTEYNDALIMKLFAFQFANTYSSLFYIAFFRGNAFQNGVFGLGSQYRDTCGETTESTCMPMLSFQVLVLMLTKPIPKFLTDVLIPVIVKLWRSKIKHCLKTFCCCFCQGQVGVEDSSKHLIVPSFIEREHQKATLGDFTLSEYTEKVIIYGFLMLFAASFPLAPLVTLCTLMVDIRVDAKRLLWLMRRPVAFIAQDIGMWYQILELLNVLGVVSNACLIAFTSHWGAKYDIVGKLLIIIGFEHIVFAVKFIIAAAIPDVPSDVKLSIRREKYQVEMVFDNDIENTPIGGIKNSFPRKNSLSGLKIEEEDEEEDPRGILYDGPKRLKRRSESSLSTCSDILDSDSDHWRTNPPVDGETQRNGTRSRNKDRSNRPKSRDQSRLENVELQPSDRISSAQRRAERASANLNDTPVKLYPLLNDNNRDTYNVHITDE